MESSIKDKNTLILELVEISTKPIFSSKNYWYESIYNILRGKAENIKTEEEYINVLKSELLYLKRLWNRELDTICQWGIKGQIPEVDEINKVIVEIENECETAVVNGKIIFKDGKSINKDYLQFIERYNAIPDSKEKIRALQEDYMYLRIRDYITLNIYQFLSENKELLLGLFKDNAKETTQRIADLVSSAADACMYPDIENV
ncbi:hypothetical protein N4T77_10065 [Clostridium sp. CX1]|uniref:hypothetical protein n=1 Tax=Clostridium sp. CX1 TaxID=2978346 RepID=UPI0021C14301|nr:hypothetical protein [Clostridium sp. CX1]MCT8976948.1 hypothetical protein [Clostridium sp. CX1]